MLQRIPVGSSPTDTWPCLTGHRRIDSSIGSPDERDAEGREDAASDGLNLFHSQRHPEQARWSITGLVILLVVRRACRSHSARDYSKVRRSESRPQNRPLWAAF